MPVEPISRRLLVGLGRYGGMVVRHARDRLTRDPSLGNQRTELLELQPGAPPLESLKSLSRKEVRQRLTEGATLPAVFEQIEAAVSLCAHMPRASGVAGQIDPHLYLFLVADLADPFAGGVVLDVARLLRIATLGRHASVLGILGLGLFLADEQGQSYLERRPGYCNVCAALREIDFVQAHGFEEAFIYDDPIPVAPPGPGFDQCFLVSEANQRGSLSSLEEHAHYVARFLLDHCRGEYLRLLEAFPGQVKNSAHAPKQPLYSSIGISSVYVPVRDIQAYCMERWAQEMCETLIAAQPTHAQEAVAAWEQIRGVLPNSTEHLAGKLKEQVDPIIDTSIPGGLPETRWEAAEMFLDVLDRIVASFGEAKLSAELESFARSEYTTPFQVRCRQQIGRLLEGVPMGIGLAEAVLDRLSCAEQDVAMAESVSELDAMSAALERSVQAQRNWLEQQVVKCRKRLKRVLATSDPPVPPRPFWLFHPIRFRQVIQQEKKFAAWVKDWQRELDSLAEASEERQVGSCAGKVLAMLGNIVQHERDEIQRLKGNLAQAAVAVAGKYHALVPRPLGVDRSLLPVSLYEEIYTGCLQAAHLASVSEAAAQVALSQRLLAGFRTSTIARLATVIESAGLEVFDRGTTMAADFVLRDARFTRCLPPLRALLDDLWQRAEPLIDAGGGLMPHNWRPGELSAVWLPDSPGSQAFVSELAALGRQPYINHGATTSFHLARVVHGFTLNTLTLLQVYARSYQPAEFKSELHILEWVDRLPTLS